MEENKNSRTIKQGNREFWKEHKKMEETKVFTYIANMYITKVFSKLKLRTY